MKRKEFLKTAIPVGLVPFFMNGFNFRAYGATPLLQLLARASAGNGRIFVIIQLNGGNDGLNTVIPIDQYANLNQASVRSNIVIPEAKILTLNGYVNTGLHPSMTGLQTMFNDGKVSIVQSVGYPNPNFSHFRATDIWNSATDSNVYEASGWMGRYLDHMFPGFPDGYPSSTNPDPLAIQIGSTVSTSLMGPTVSMGMAITDPTSFYQLVSGTVDPAPAIPAGHELTYVRLVAQQSQQYLTTIKTAASAGTNMSSLYPTGNPLADALKIVAKLVKGGLTTPVYMVNLGGFDTHSNQVSASGGTETGAHADLLKKISDAIYAFQDDLKLMGVEDKVAGMTYSEFGRRIKSNASLGTDHGAAAPMIVFGKNVNPGIIGTNPQIPSTVTVNDNVPMQYDFRQVYTSVLQDWFQLDKTIADTDMLYKPFNTLPIFRQNLGIDDLFATNNEHSALFQNYPNPFQTNTTIEFISPGGAIELRLFDNQGRLIRTLASGDYPKGKHSQVLTDAGLAAGNYYYQLVTAKGQSSRLLVKM